MRPSEFTTSREPRVEAVGRPPQRAPDGAPIHYERHRVEQTKLYRLMQRYAAHHAVVDRPPFGDRGRVTEVEQPPSRAEVC